MISLFDSSLDTISTTQHTHKKSDTKNHYGKRWHHVMSNTIPETNPVKTRDAQITITMFGVIIEWNITRYHEHGEVKYYRI
jgi:uncharacterized Rmd1/YagE family protein